MPWKQTDPMTERVKMITDHLSGNYNPTDLGRRYGISRESVYKWLERFEELGWAGLGDRPRASLRRHSLHRRAELPRNASIDRHQPEIVPAAGHCVLHHPFRS